METTQNNFDASQADNSGYVRNFFISSFVAQTEQQLTANDIGKTFGKLLSLGYIVRPYEKTNTFIVDQKVEFENMKFDKELTKEEENTLTGALGFNIVDEMEGRNQFNKPCKKIICLVNVDPQSISIRFIFTDGTNETIEI